MNTQNYFSFFRILLIYICNNVLIGDGPTKIPFRKFNWKDFLLLFISDRFSRHAYPCYKNLPFSKQFRETLISQTVKWFIAILFAFWSFFFYIVALYGLWSIPSWSWFHFQPRRIFLRKSYVKFSRHLGCLLNWWHVACPKLWLREP